MANEEHLHILLSGVETWNDWRRTNPTVSPELKGANLTNVNLYGANLRRVNLIGADLSCANLIGADLSCANLKEANFSRANLKDAGLSANLYGANLTDANLTGSDLFGGQLHYANVGDTSFSRLSLFGIQALGTVRHLFPSSIGINVLERTASDLAKDSCSQHEIEVFLDKAGIPNEYIEFFRSRIGQPIQFYSCFISYSSKNQDFANRLYADLRQKGIRCWLATEDLKIGDEFRMRINDAIRIHDKLMVVLSENSVNSTWVEDEVEAALERENTRREVVLFPIRLDDAVMQTDQAWAATIRRKRHIGDFRRWKNHDEYQKSLVRLVRDLQADAQPKSASV